MNDVVARTALGFERHFGRSPDVVASAPGRVNLIGEHTDYNGGLVLPIAIDAHTVVALAKCEERSCGTRVRAASEQAAGAREEFTLGRETRSGRWIDYLQGCTLELRTTGASVGGFDAYVASDVPLGAGLSSSAALEVAALRALRTAFAFALDDVALALVAHHAENRFVRVRVGVMDQMAASLADTTTALFLDARSLAFERIALPSAAAVLVFDSGVKHDHATGGYNTRREECERAAEGLGVRTLRELTAGDLDRISSLPQPLARRARHVVTENARVLAAVAALRSEDLVRVGTLLSESHASLRDDFEVSVAAVDRLVEIASADPAVFGARMTGGGFGGAVVVLAESEHSEEVTARVAAAYASDAASRA